MIIDLYPGQINLKGPQSATSTDLRPYRAGSMLLTGLAITVATTVALGAGVLTASGQALTPFTGPFIQLGAGSLVFKGPQALTGASTVITPGAGSLVLAGQAPTNVSGLMLSLPAGTLQFTGYMASQDSVAAFSAGSQTFLGLIPTLLNGFTISPPAGSLVFKGPAAPSFLFDIPAGTLNLTGKVLFPQIVSPLGGDQTFALPNGVITWSGKQLASLPDKTILLSAGVLTLSGQYVSVQFMTPPAGSLVWHGLILTVGTSAVILMPAGNLGWTGQPLVIGSISTVFRRTLSRLGTRTGSRQVN